MLECKSYRTIFTPAGGKEKRKGEKMRPTIRRNGGNVTLSIPTKLASMASRKSLNVRSEIK